MKKLSNSDAELKKKNVTFIAEPSGEYPERNFADDSQTEKTKKTIKHGVSGLPNSYSFTIFIQNRRL